MFHILTIISVTKCVYGGNSIPSHEIHFQQMTVIKVDLMVNPSFLMEHLLNNCIFSTGHILFGAACDLRYEYQVVLISNE